MIDHRIDFFLPGPTWVRPDVLEAQQRPMMGHRSTAFRDLYGAVAERLQRVFRTRGDVMMASGSATLIMESAVISTVASDVLNLTCGAFSERWHAICRANGKTADKVEVPWGQAVDPDLVRGALRRKRYEAVTLVHNETSTGVLNPVADIAQVIHEESDALVLVDTVSSLAGARVEVDEWDLDVVLTSTQKALAVPPGLALFTLSERAAGRAEKMAHRGFYTDLLRYRDKHRQGGTITTPALSIVQALHRQLDVVLEEGMQARWERHRGLQAMTAKWAAANEFEYVAPSVVRSPTVSCLRPPATVAAPDLVRSLASRGITVGGGYGRWKPETFRIGHMGEVRGNDLERLFHAIEESTLSVHGG